MGLLSAELATKRLQSANATQDGIEAISTWMLHHTDSVRMLADCWLNLFRTEAEERRVVLFYIMNDVVQRAKKKHVDVFCSTFEQPAISAVSLGRFSEKLRSVMSRCLKLIAECKAFTVSGIDKMNRIIADPNGDTDDGNYEIDVMELAKKIEAFMKSVHTIGKGYEILKRAPVDLEDQIQTRMKDRKEGAVLLKETRTSILKLEKFGEAVINNNKRLYEFVDAIETAKRLFNMQLRDVAVVEDAYVKFGQGVREVQDEVEEMVRSGVYPAGSPPRDAPSPSAEDDVFAAGVEQVLNKMRPHDLTDEADMDVDDDEPPLPPQPWEKKQPAPIVSSSSRPSLVERAAALAANMPSLASHMGIDPRARANTAPSVSAATAAPSTAPSTQPPPAKKPLIDSAAISSLHAAYVLAAKNIPIPAQQAAQQPATTPAPASAPPVASYSLPPPPFTPNIPPPPPGFVAHMMAMQQQGGAPPSLAVPTHPPSLPPSAPPISPFSAPPPGYPPVSTPNAPPPQQYANMQQNRPPTHYSAPPPTHGYSGYGNAGGATGGYQPPVAAAANHQQFPPAPQGGGYGMEQQPPKKYTAMPEFNRSNSTPGATLISPSGGGHSGYYPMPNTPSTPGASTSASAPSAGTPYTPTAPGLRGRKGSDGGGYGRGGGYGGGYGNRQEEQSDDAYHPQYRKDSFESQDVDFRQQQPQQQQQQPPQYPMRGGGGGGNRGYARGNQGGYGRGGGFQRGGGQRGRGGFGGQNNFGGGYSNQGY